MARDLQNDYAVIADGLGGTLINWWPLTGGVSAEVHALLLRRSDGETERVVVRRHSAHAWKPHDANVLDREHAVMTTLADRGFAVPRPRVLDGSGALVPFPYLVLPFVDAEPNPAQTRVGLAAMAEFLERLHDLDVTRIESLRGLPLRVDPVPEILDALPTGFESVARHLRQTAPAPAVTRALLHGDFWTGNTLWRDDTIVGVIDWEDTAIGDPHSDVASCGLELLWKYGATEMDAFTEHYRRARPAAIDPTRLAVWRLYVASTALVSMPNWGLEPAVMAEMKMKAQWFMEAAARQVIDGA